MLSLPTRAGNMCLSCPLGFFRVCSRNLGVTFWPYIEPFIDQALFGQDGWVLALFFFFAFIWTETLGQ